MSQSANGVVSLLDSVKKHSKFKALAAYSMACLTQAVDTRSHGWRENVKEVVKNGGVGAIASVLNEHPGDSKIMGQASTTLHRLAVDGSAARAIVKEGAIKSVMASLQAARKKDAGAAGGAAAGRARAEGGEPPSLEVSLLLQRVAERATEVFVEESGVEAVMEVLKTVENAPALPDASALEADSPQARAVRAQVMAALACTAALEHSSRSKLGRDKLVSTGAVRMAVTRMEQARVQRQAAAKAAPRRRASDARTPSSAALAARGGPGGAGAGADSDEPDLLQDAASALLEGAEDEGQRSLEFTFRMLDRVCRSSEHAEALRSTGAVDAVVSVLDSCSDNASLARTGGKLLSKMVASGIDGVIAQLQRGVAGPERERAAALLAHLAVEDDNVDAIVRCGGVSALVRAFEVASTQRTLESTGRALARLANSPANVEAIVAEGGVAVLVDALRKHRDNPQVLAFAAPALARLAVSEETASAIVEGGGLAAIIGSLAAHPEQADNARSALEFVEALAEQELEVQALLDAGSIAAVARALAAHPEDKRLQVRGTRALALLATSEDTVNAMAEHGVVDCLLANLQRHGDSAELVTQSLHLAASVALVPAHAAAMAAKGGVNAVVAAMGLHAKDEAVREAAADVVAVLATEADVQARVRDLVAKVARFKGPRAPDAAAAAALLDAEHIVAALAVAPNAADVIAAAGGVEALAQLVALVSERADCPMQDQLLATASRSLRTLAASSEAAREAVVASGGVTALVQACKAHPKLARASAEALELMDALVAEAEAAESVGAVVAAGGVAACQAALRASPADRAVCEPASRMLLHMCSAGHAETLVEQGSVRQVLGVLKEATSAAELATSGERMMRVLEAMSRVPDAKDVLLKQDAVATVTACMEAYAGTEGADSMLRAGGRVLARLMDREQVAHMTQDLVAMAERVTTVASMGGAAGLKKTAVLMRNVGFLAGVGTNAGVVVRSGGSRALVQLLQAARRLPESEERQSIVTGTLNTLALVAQNAEVDEVARETAEAAIDCLAAAAAAPSGVAGALNEEEAVAALATDAAACVSAATRSEQGARAVVERGAVVQLVALASSEQSTPAAVLHALTALANVASHPDLAPDVLAAGALDLAADLMRSGADDVSPAAAAAALRLLSALGTHCPAARDRLAADGAAVAVASAALSAHCGAESSTHLAVLRAAATLLDCACDHPAAVRQALEASAARKLVRAAAANPNSVADADTMAACARVLHKLCADADAAEQVRQSGAGNMLRAAMEAGASSDAMRTAATAALSAIDASAASEEAALGLGETASSLAEAVAALAALQVGEEAEGFAAAREEALAPLLDSLLTLSDQASHALQIEAAAAAAGVEAATRALQALCASTVPATQADLDALNAGLRAVTLLATKQEELPDAAACVAAVARVLAEMGSLHPSVVESAAQAIGALSRHRGAVQAVARSGCLPLLEGAAQDVEGVPSAAQQAASKALEQVTARTQSAAASLVKEEGGAEAVQAVISAHVDNVQQLSTCVESIASADGGDAALLDVLASVMAEEEDAAGAAGAAGAAVVELDGITPSLDGATAAPAALSAGAAKSLAMKAEIVRVLASKTVEGTRAVVHSAKHVKCVAAAVKEARAVQAAALTSNLADCKRVMEDGIRLLSRMELTHAHVNELVTEGTLDTIVQVTEDVGASDTARADCLNLLSRMAEQSPAVSAKVCQSAQLLPQIVKGVRSAHQSKPIMVQSLNVLASLCNTMGAKSVGLDKSAQRAIEEVMHTHLADPEIQASGQRLLGILAGQELEDPAQLLAARHAALAASAEGVVGVVEEFMTPDGRSYFVDRATNETSWEPPQRFLAAVAAARDLATTVARFREDGTALPGEVLATAVQLLSRAGRGGVADWLLSAVKDVAGNGAVVDELVHAGGLQAVMQAAQANADSSSAQAAAAATLELLSRTQHRDLLAHAGSIELMVAMVQRLVNDLDVVKPCLGALATLAINNPPNVARLFAANAAEMVNEVLVAHMKTSAVVELALCLLQNMLAGSVEAKLRVCYVCGPNAIVALRTWFRDPQTLKALLRLTGDLALSDRNVLYFLQNQVVESIVQAMAAHADRTDVLQVCVETLGNLLSVADEEQAEALGLDMEQLEAAAVAAVHASGVVGTLVAAAGDPRAQPALLIACVETLCNISEHEELAPLVVEEGALEAVLGVMQRLTWDEELVQHCITFLATLSYSAECLPALATPDAVHALLESLESTQERPEAQQNAVLALANVAADQEGRRLLGDQRGVQALCQVLQMGMENQELVRGVIAALLRMAGADELSEKVAQHAMHLIMAALAQHEDDPEFAQEAFALVGHLAYVEANLKDVVQHGGVARVVAAIGTHPDHPALMKRCIQTLETVATASKDYAAIVIEEGGKMCIEELMRVYTDDPELQRCGRSALLAIQVLDNLQQEEEAQRRARHKPARPE